MNCKTITIWVSIFAVICTAVSTVFLVHPFSKNSLLEITPINDLYNAVLIKIPQGKIEGRQIKLLNNVTSFYNIPYTAPPIGELRFEPPDFQNLKKWGNEVRDSKNRGVRCPEKSGSEQKVSDVYDFSEDCLYLNVATRNLRKSENDELWPVLVFIHGGGFFEGSASQWRHDVSVLASGRGNGVAENEEPENDIVVVSFNYRLGVLGFLGMNSTFLGEQSTGNFGLMDQYAAINWVKQNIEFFGGDPEKLTCMGMSAGSESCAIHSVWEDSKNLADFSGMILTSNAYLPYYDVSQSAGLVDQLKVKQNCETEDSELLKSCLQKLGFQDLVDTSVIPPISTSGNTAIFQTWPPTVGGSILPDQVFPSLLKSAENNELPPFFVTTSNDEGESLIRAVVQERLSVPLYRQLMTVLFRNDSSKIIEKYYNNGQECPIVENRADCAQTVIEIARDYMFYCPERYILNSIGKRAEKSSNKTSDETLIKTSENSVSNMLWFSRPAFMRRNLDDHSTVNCLSKSCHADILFWILGTDVLVDYYQLNDDSGNEEVLKPFYDRYPDGIEISQIDRDLGVKMRSFVTNFVVKQTPGANWKNYSENHEFFEVQRETGEVRARNDDSGQLDLTFDASVKCDFWDDLMVYGYY